MTTPTQSQADRLAELHEALAAEYRRIARSPESGLASLGGHEQSQDEREGDKTVPDSTDMQTATATPIKLKAHRRMTELPVLLTQDELAALLGLNVRTVRRLIHEGEVPEGFEVGGSKRWRRADIERWLEDRAR